MASAVSAEEQNRALAGLAIAARLGVSAGAVGQVRDEEKGKIVNCQLGCFGSGKSKPKL